MRSFFSRHEWRFALFAMPKNARPEKKLVKLNEHDSIFVPLAKWPILMVRNYRFIRWEGLVPLNQAIHGTMDNAWASDVNTYFEKSAEKAGAVR